MSLPDGAVDRRSGLDRRIHTKETWRRFTWAKRGFTGYDERRRYHEGGSTYLLSGYIGVRDRVMNVAYVDRRRGRPQC